MGKPDYKLGLLKIPVTDVEHSAKFYEEILHLELGFVVPEYGWAQMKAGETDLALYVPGKGGGERQIGGNVDFHLVLEPRDFDELAPTLKDAGHLSENMIHTGNDGSTFIDVYDPDKNIIKVLRKQQPK